MLTPAAAFAILADVIRYERRHQDYDHVVALRKFYHQLISGQDAHLLLEQFVMREDSDAYRQRLAITQLVVIAWAGMIMQQFYRPGRLRNIKRTIAYKSDVPGAAKKIAEIEDRVGSYWGRESLERWLATRFVSLSFHDPNAFVVTEFKAFNSLNSKAKPYPVEYTAEEAITFRYTNNVLDYLVVKQMVQRVVAGGKIVAAAKYTMYLDNDIIVAEQLPEAESTTGTGFNAAQPDDSLPANGGIWAKDEKDSYRITTYQPRGGRVQAVRVGYQFDDITNGRTMVSPMHRATPFFMKSIHATSELDLSIALHVHPQKIFYAIPCPGMPRKQCLSGITSDQVNGVPVKCARCSGLGVIVHKSAQDALAIPLPPVGSPAPAVPLDKMVAYITPDIKVVEFLDTYLRATKLDAIDAVFNSGVSSQQQSTSSSDGGGPAPAKTATEVVVTDDRADNTLAPFTDQCAAIWRYKVELIAELLDNNHPDLALVYRYPSSNAIKTYEQIVAERKAAADAGAPHYVIQELDRQLAEMLFSDDESTLARIKAKNFFTPFLGKSSDEFFTLVSLGKVRPEDEVLWGYVDTIFDEIADENPEFFSLTRAKQWELIKPRVELIQAAFPQSATAIALPPADPNQGAATFKVGDRVKVKAGQEHVMNGMKMGGAGTVSIVENGAYGITLDSMPNEVHKWYVASELEPEKATKPKPQPV